MKTLKTVTVLIFTAALFFSCAQETGSEYGTLVINPFGSSSARAVEAKNAGIPDDIFKDLEYSFKCKNEKADPVTAGPYKVNAGKQDVQIQLLPGTWVVSVNILQFETNVIGSNEYKPVTINAGQTVILGGIEVETFPYGHAKARHIPDNFGSFDDLANWKDIPTTIYINRYAKLGTDGQVLTGSNQPPTYTPTTQFKPHGTAKILWDKNALYVLVLVEDAACISNRGTQEHDTDSVEIFFNDGGSGHQYRIDYGEKETYGFYPKGVAEGSASNYKKESHLPNGVSLSLIKDNLPNDVKYAVVAQIAFVDDRNIEDIIGIDLQINGAPIPGSNTRSTVAVWFDKTATAYTHPSLYEKTLTLVD